MSYIGKDFYQNISMGGYSNIVRWGKLGYTPTVTTTESDIWSAAGLYVFPSAAKQLEVISSLATADVDVGAGAFTLYDATSDVGGTTTTLLDATYNFAATAAAGDIILISKSGNSSTAALTPEWGILTAVGNGTVTFAAGLSSGGTCSVARAYQILDVSVAKGAMAVKIDYLTNTYAEQTELVITNGNTAVPLVKADVYRVNSFRVIAVGTKATALNACGGNLSLLEHAALTYSYIIAGRTRARNSVYTVPTGKTLYLSAWNMGMGKTATGNDYSRFIVRANVEPTTLLNTGLLLYPFVETATQGSIDFQIEIPIKFPAKTDIKTSVVTSATTGTNVATSVLRGFLTTP